MAENEAVKDTDRFETGDVVRFSYGDEETVGIVKWDTGKVFSGEDKGARKYSVALPSGVNASGWTTVNGPRATKVGHVADYDPSDPFGDDVGDLLDDRTNYPEPAGAAEGPTHPHDQSEAAYNRDRTPSLLDDEAADDGVSLSVAGTRTLSRQYGEETVETTVFEVETTTPEGHPYSSKTNAVRIGCPECRENVTAVIQGETYRCVCGFSNGLTRETLLRQGRDVGGEWVPY